MTKEIKNKYIKGIIRLVTFFLILFICLQIVYNITKRKDSYLKMEEFFSQEEDFDVLFFGSSHTSNTVLPMKLWNDYGIISYNLGNPTETIVTSYYNMLLALKETNPELVVIDAYYCNSYKKIDKKQYIHNTLDSYPLSYTKYLAIKDLFSEEDDMLNSMFEFLFNFSLYHDRWDELSESDFGNLKKYPKGASGRTNLAVPNEINSFDSVDMYDKKENINMQYLKRIFEYCKQKEIEVLVTFYPFPASDEQIAVSKYVQTVCNEYNVNYINFLSMGDIVDYQIDCADENSHLNLSGSKKVTNYIGKYIMEHYNIQDQRKNESYSFWQDDYNKYIDYKITKLKENEKVLNNYLMLLYGEKDIKYEIKISSIKEIKEGTTLYNLLENLENNYEIDDSVFEDKEDKTIKITTWDKRDGSLIDTLWW